MRYLQQLERKKKKRNKITTDENNNEINKKIKKSQQTSAATAISAAATAQVHCEKDYSDRKNTHTLTLNTHTQNQKEIM